MVAWNQVDLTFDDVDSYSKRRRTLSMKVSFSMKNFLLEIAYAVVDVVDEVEEAYELVEVIDQ